MIDLPRGCGAGRKSSNAFAVTVLQTEQKVCPGMVGRGRQEGISKASHDASCSPIYWRGTFPWSIATKREKKGKNVEWGALDSEVCWRAGEKARLWLARVGPGEKREKRGDCKTTIAAVSASDITRVVG